MRIKTIMSTVMDMIRLFTFLSPQILLHLSKEVLFMVFKSEQSNTLFQELSIFF